MAIPGDPDAIWPTKEDTLARIRKERNEAVDKLEAISRGIAEERLNEFMQRRCDDLVERVLDAYRCTVNDAVSDIQDALSDD
jgi:hypothetical protein